jgi:uncharacterized membrane protein
MVTALIGLVDAMYLLSHRITGEPIACGLTGGCNIVAASPHSVIFGIPLSLLGVLFYFGIIVLIAIEFSSLKNFFERYIPIHSAQRAYAIIGLASSAYFTYLQHFIIRAWCQYCILSAFCTVIIFIIIFLRTRKQSYAQV